MKQAPPPFSAYQKLIVAIIALLQFTVVLDFMVMSPLGDMLIKALKISPNQFGLVVSAYAFSAAASGILVAGFADKFDRKKMLLVFYAGFVGGTLLCGMAQTYEMLLFARIITGIFGGIIGSVSMAIITDLFEINQRGRVMGFVQMGFAVSQILGIPISLSIANHFSWQTPFIAIVGFAVVLGFVVLIFVKPINAHLSLQSDKNALAHLWHVLKQSKYQMGFLTAALLPIGGFMLMPFSSAFAINNLQVTNEQLPYLFMLTGISSIIIMPVVGKLSDKFDKLIVFLVGTIWASVMVIIYTNIQALPFWQIVALNIVLFMGIMSRIIPATALISAVPEPKDRGAFMSMNASLQQMAGGIAALISGMVVVQKTTHSPIEHFNTLGYIVVAVMAVGIYFLWRVNTLIKSDN
jgi:predicted MFS family arabinose efflux permease